MNSTLTVSVKGLVTAGLVLLALVTAYLLGGGGGSPGAPAQAASTPASPAEPVLDARTLRMVGTGEVSVVPDQLTFNLSVTDQQPGLDQALADSSATMERVLARLRDFGVREGDLQTTGLQMYPEYDYPSYGPRVLTGYRVTQKAQVTIRDLAQAGRAVSTAVESGGNAVRASDLRLGVSDLEAALAKARDAAVDVATTKAEQYAEATGQALGDVLGLREVGSDGGSGQPRSFRGGSLRAAYDEAVLPIKAGKDDLSVRVEVLWEFA